MPDGQRRRNLQSVLDPTEGWKLTAGERRGLAALEAAAEPAAWLARRVHTLRFATARSAAHRVTCHVDARALAADHPELVEPASPDREDARYLLLPVGVLGRVPHVTVTVSCGGNELPRLTIDEERALVADGLVGQLKAHLSSESVPRTPGLAAYLAELREAIADAPPGQQTNDLLAAVGKTVEGKVKAEGKAAIGKAFNKDPELRRLFNTWLQSCLLAACVMRGGRLVVDYEHSSALQHRLGGKLGGVTEAGSLDKAGFFARWAGAAYRLLSMQRVRYDIALGDAGSCRSYHLEVLAPDDVCVSRTELRVMRDDGGFELRVDDDRDPTRGHAFWRNAGTEKAEKALLTVELNTSPSGLSRFAPFCVGLVVGILLAGVVYLAVLGWRGDGTRDIRLPADKDSATALLLLLPAFVAGAVIRPGEHSVASRTLLSTRAHVAAIVPLLMGVGATVALGWTGRGLITVWAGALIAATFLLVRLSRKYVAADRDWRGESSGKKP